MKKSSSSAKSSRSFIPLWITKNDGSVICTVIWNGWDTDKCDFIVNSVEKVIWCSPMLVCSYPAFWIQPDRICTVFDTTDNMNLWLITAVLMDGTWHSNGGEVRSGSNFMQQSRRLQAGLFDGDRAKMLEQHTKLTSFPVGLLVNWVSNICAKKVLKCI